MNKGYDQIHIIYPNQCIIYTLSGSKKPNWYYRFKIPGEGKYRKKSLKTTDKNSAISLATEKYHQMISLRNTGVEFGDIKISTVWKTFIKTREENQKKTTKHKAIWDRYLKEYFGNKEVSALNRKLMIKYWDYRLNFWKTRGKGTPYWKKNRPKNLGIYALNPSHSTLRREQSILRSFIRFVSRHYLINVDPIDDIKARRITNEDGTFSVQNSRGRFWDADEYTQFTRWLQAKCDEGGLVSSSKRKKTGRPVSSYRRKSTARSWAKTRMFIYLIANTGIRVEEAKLLKYQDYKRDEETGCGFINVSDKIAKPKQGQRSGREVLSFAFAKHDNGDVYCLLGGMLQQFRQEWYPEASDDDLIFQSDKDKQKPADMTYLVRTALKQSGFYKDKDGKIRTGTTFRHHFAQQRILSGNISMTLLAQTMGNTVEVLERVYVGVSAKQKFISMIENADSISQSDDIITAKAAYDLKKIERSLLVAKQVQEWIDEGMSSPEIEHFEKELWEEFEIV